jgi:protein TonB
VPLRLAAQRLRFEQTPMTTTLAATLESVSKQASARLLVACALSLLLHLALLLGIPVNPTGGVPGVVPTIYARLEPAADNEPPAPAATLGPADTTTVAADAGEQKKTPASKAETRPEPQPATAPAASPSGGIEVPLIRDPAYYPAQQLDVYPRPLTPIRLNYPDAAAAERADGRLLVLLLIDEFGVVNEASVVEAQPAGSFEETTLAVFRATRFSPAKKQGHAVKSRVLLQVKYLYGDSAGAVR